MKLDVEAIGVKVFELWELRWMAEALAVKLTTEQNKLEFLEHTIDLADNEDWHQAQIAVQREIVAAHQNLLRKVREE